LTAISRNDYNDTDPFEIPLLSYFAAPGDSSLLILVQMSSRNFTNSPSISHPEDEPDFFKTNFPEGVK